MWPAGYGRASSRWNKKPHVSSLGGRGQGCGGKLLLAVLPLEGALKNSTSWLLNQCRSERMPSLNRCSRAGKLS